MSADPAADSKREVLAGLHVAVTRSSDASPDRLASLLETTGAIPVHVPLTSTEPPHDPKALVEAARELSGYDWLVVTSARTVGPFQSALQAAGMSAERLKSANVRVCAVGPRTGEALEAAGMPPDLIPSRFDAEGVVESILQLGDPAGLRVLFPRAEEGRDVISRLLRGVGVHVEVVPAYRTIALPAAGRRLWDMIDTGQLDALTFTAGSAVAAFADAWSDADEPSEVEARREAPEIPGEVGVMALGPATAAALEGRGMRVDRVAQPHTLDGLVSALHDWARVRNNKG